MHDRRRIVEEILGNRQDRLAEVQAHRVVVDLLDGARALALAHLGLAVLVLLAGVVILGQAVEEADVGGAGLRVEPALEVEDDVVGVEGVAIVPLDVLPQIRRSRS